MPIFRRVAKVELPQGGTIIVQSDIKSLETRLRRFGGNIKRAETRALNKSLLKTRSQARRGIAKKFNLPAKVVNPQVTSTNATRSNGTAYLQGRGSRIPIFKTKGAKTQKRLGVSVNTGTGRRVIKHAFIGTMPSGHTGIFKRTLGVPIRRFYYTDTQGRRQNRQLPIRELTFPPMSHMITNKRVADELFLFFTRDYPLQYRRQLNAEYDRGRGVG